jgi:hypothetical protein
MNTLDIFIWSLSFHRESNSFFFFVFRHLDDVRSEFTDDISELTVRSRLNWPARAETRSGLNKSEINAGT